MKDNFKHCYNLRTYLKVKLAKKRYITYYLCPLANTLESLRHLFTKATEESFSAKFIKLLKIEICDGIAFLILFKDSNKIIILKILVRQQNDDKKCY